MQVSKALGQTNGSNAASLAVAEKYVTAFQELARTNNTLILPSNTGDVSSMVAQVWTSLTFLMSELSFKDASIRVVKILENHTLDLASNYEVFSRLNLENASKIEGFRGLPSKMSLTLQLLEASASKFEVLKPTLKKPSVG